MNRVFLLSGIAVILVSLSVRSAYAQDEIQFGNRRFSAHEPEHPARTNSGFWVVESSLATPRSVTVRFYEEGNRLIYEEHLMGVRMDVSRRRTRRKLDQRLREVQAARFGVGVAGISRTKER